MGAIPDTRQLGGPAGQQLLLGGPAGYVPATDAEGAGFSLADVMRVLKQRKMTIIITFLVVYILMVGATIATWKFAPAYVSSAMIELAPPRQDVYGSQSEMVDTRIMEQQLQTEARKLKELSVLREVLAMPEVKGTSYYQWYKGDISKALYDLSDELISTPIPDSNLIRVSLQAQKPAEAKLIVEKIVNRYLAKYGDVSREELFRQTEALRQTLARGQAELTNKRNEIQVFRERTDVPTLESENQDSSLYVYALRSRMTDYETQSSRIQAQLDSVSGVEPQNLPITPEMQILVESDPILRFYRSQVETLDIEVQTAKLTVGANHRQVQSLVARRQGYSDKEVARREELLDQMRARQVESLQQELAEVRNMMARLQDELESAEARQRDMDRNLQRYHTMQDDEKALRDNITQLEGRLREAEHAYNDRSSTRLTLVQQADEPTRPSRPNFPIWLGGGFVLAMLAGIGLAFLREFTDQRVRTALDISRHANMAVLGSVPLLDDEQADMDDIVQATRSAPHSLVAEAFRQIRTNLLFSGPADAQRSLLITSPGPEDGKTAVAVNLAVTLAHSGQRVLLVDCNFRRPRVRQALGITRTEGLSNLLTGQGQLSNLISKTELPLLDVLSSGPLPPTPAELLGSPQMRDMLREAMQSYDRVVLDGPPVLLVSDALVLATQVHGVIVVARAVANSRGALRRAREQLERISGRILGSVLNGVRVSPGGYLKRQYRAFYDYVDEEEPPVMLPGKPEPLSNEPEIDVPPDDENERR